jgi:hypothetical protein
MASAATATPGQQQQQQLVQDQSLLVQQLQAELGSLARELAQLKRSQQQQQQRSDSASLQSCFPGKQGRALEPFAAAGPLAHELQVSAAAEGRLWVTVFVRLCGASMLLSQTH